MSKKQRRESKKETSLILDTENQIKELESENRELLAALFMLETSNNCWCPKSIARDKMIAAGLEVKHTKQCLCVRNILCKK